MALLPMFILLLATGIGLSGATGYLIFGPLAYRHLQDRQQAIGAHAFAPSYLNYLLRGRYRMRNDPNLNGLATPARVLLICALAGAAGAGLVLALT